MKSSFVRHCAHSGNVGQRSLSYEAVVYEENFEFSLPNDCATLLSRHRGKTLR